MRWPKTILMIAGLVMVMEGSAARAQTAPGEPALAAVEVAPIPRAKPDRPGSADADPPRDTLDRPSAERPTLAMVLELSDQQIIDRYGLNPKLSPMAQLVAATVAATSDANVVCDSRSTLRAAMEPVIRGLAAAGKIEGNLWPVAFEAGRFMYVNCGKL